MQEDAFSAATERINAGAEIPTVDPSLIEHLWLAINRIPRPQRQQTAIGLGAFARCDPDALPKNPDEHVAMMARCALLDALVERGVLDDYMKEESQRKKVFAAAASFPCDKNDLGEALTERVLRDLPPDQLEEANEQLKQAGYDRDHLRVTDKFITWMRDNY